MPLPDLSAIVIGRTAERGVYESGRQFAWRTMTVRLNQLHPYSGRLSPWKAIAAAGVKDLNNLVFGNRNA